MGKAYDGKTSSGKVAVNGGKVPRYQYSGWASCDWSRETITPTTNWWFKSACRMIAIPAKDSGKDKPSWVRSAITPIQLTQLLVRKPRLPCWFRLFVEKLQWPKGEIQCNFDGKPLNPRGQSQQHFNHRSMKANHRVHQISMNSISTTSYQLGTSTASATWRVRWTSGNAMAGIPESIRGSRKRSSGQPVKDEDSRSGLPRCTLITSADIAQMCVERLVLFAGTMNYCWFVESLSRDEWKK